jgi:hypothetical protein
MNIAHRATPVDRRLGLLLTLLVHAALLLGWQAARRPPQLPAPGKRAGIQWIRLPAPASAPRTPTPAELPLRAQPVPARPRPLPAPALPLPALPENISSTPVPAAPAVNGSATPPVPAAAATVTTPSASASAQPATSAPSAEQILQQARRDIGKIDKALRKENRPYITAPLDSPQMRLRRGIEQANAMAPNRIWEAPKSEELVNNTGDGARRSRVITGNGSYCVTERSPATSIDMIEKHGKLRITNCPAHEEPAKQQEWRTARD